MKKDVIYLFCAMDNLAVGMNQELQAYLEEKQKSPHHLLHKGAA